MNRRTLLFTSLALALFTAHASAANVPTELHVLCSNASRPAIAELIPQFEKNSGVKVQMHYENNPILKKNIEAGAEFDVVIIEPAMLADLAKAGFVKPDTPVDLAAIGMALVAREGTAAVDIGSAESFKKALLAADSISYTADGFSGTVFLRTLDKLGLSEAMKPKLVPVTGKLSTQTVIDGSTQYTAFPLGTAGPGLQIVGHFPEQVQTYIGISGGISARTAASAPATALLKHLQSPSAKALFKRMGFRPSP